MGAWRASSARQTMPSEYACNHADGLNNAAYHAEPVKIRFMVALRIGPTHYLPTRLPRLCAASDSGGRLLQQFAYHGFDIGTLDLFAEHVPNTPCTVDHRGVRQRPLLVAVVRGDIHSGLDTIEHGIVDT